MHEEPYGAYRTPGNAPAPGSSWHRGLGGIEVVGAGHPTEIS